MSKYQIGQKVNGFCFKTGKRVSYTVESVSEKPDSDKRGVTYFANGHCPDCGKEMTQQRHEYTQEIEAWIQKEWARMNGLTDVESMRALGESLKSAGIDAIPPHLGNESHIE